LHAHHDIDRESIEPSRPSRRAILGLALGGLAVLAGLETSAAKPKRRLKSQAKPNKGKKQDKLSANAKRRRPRRPKFKVLTRTFSNATPIVIPNNNDGISNPYPSEIKVTGFRQAKVLDVNVTLHNFSHTYPEDVNVLLESPNFRRAVIFSDVGNEVDATNLTFVLDDQASAILPPNSPLGSGTFKPTNDGLVDEFPAPAAPSSNVALSTFNNINPNGLWKVYVYDDASPDGGSFAGGWSLTLKVRARV
jgi:subtilisin-like proprotein convertase family protein